MFYSAVRYVYRRRDLIGRITQCFTQPLGCHQSVRFTCVVSQLRRPHKMWGWSLWRLTAGTELSYSTKFITEDEYNDLIRCNINEFERDAKEYHREDGRSVAEIISAYESGVSNAENDLDGVLRYMYAVSLTCLRDSPRYENVHLLQDDRLSSALQTILNKGLVKGSDPLQLNRLLVVGRTIQPSPEILQFYKELERHMTQVWSRWHVMFRMDVCHKWFHLSILHEQKYFEVEIRFFLKLLMKEAKLKRKKLEDKEIHQLFSVLQSATHYSLALDGKWVDKNDVSEVLHLKTICQHHSKKDVLAAVQKNLGGPHLARITPVLPIYHPIVELCLNELNEPVDMKLVPRVFDENGFLKMENMSALPEGWRKIAVWFLRDEDLFINKPEELTGIAQARKRFLHQAGYKEVLEVPFSMTKLKSADLHKQVRDMLKQIPDISLPKK